MIGQDSRWPVVVQKRLHPAAVGDTLSTKKMIARGGGVERGSSASPLSYCWVRHSVESSISRQVRPGMYFPFNCLGCGHENHAGWSQIGQRLSCRVCGRAAIVPAPMEPVEGRTRWEFVVRFACLICGRSFAAKPELVGQKIRCSGCGAGVRVPAGNSFPVEHKTSIVLHALSGNNRAIAPPKEPARGVRPPADRSSSAANPWWRDPDDGTSDSNRSKAPTTGPWSSVRPPAGHSSPVANPWPVPSDDDSGDRHWVTSSTTDAVPAAPARSEIDPWRSQDQLEAIADFTRSEHAAVVLPSRGEMMEQVQQEAAKQEAAEVAQVAEKTKKTKKKRRKKTGISDLKETLTMLGEWASSSVRWESWRGVFRRLGSRSPVSWS